VKNRRLRALTGNSLALLSIVLASSCQIPQPTASVRNQPANTAIEKHQLLDTTRAYAEATVTDPQAMDRSTTPSTPGLRRDSTQSGQESADTSTLTNSSSASAQATTQNTGAPSSPSPNKDFISPATIKRPQTTGNLASAKFVEVSGLATSLRDPDLLWVINDSGNSAQLHALSRNGSSRGSWLVSANNRDWEDLAAATINGEPYLFIGDIGDNQRSHDEYAIHVVREPELNARLPGQASATVLEPDWTIRFRYEDGAHNAEAMAVVNEQLILLTKEPITNDHAVPAGIYTLALGPAFSGAAVSGSKSVLHIAVHAGKMQARDSSFESRLAATFANVDLNHVTALSIDQDRNVAWLLTYRSILRFKRQTNQSWVQALTGRGLRAYRHNLEQAEALDVSADGLVWFTSEGESAPLWVLPANQGVANTN